MTLSLNFLQLRLLNFEVLVNDRFMFIAGALGGLASLSQLVLVRNRLILLEWSVFDVLDFMEFGGHPGSSQDPLHDAPINPTFCTHH